jgi:hypothetical protein
MGFTYAFDLLVSGPQDELDSFLTAPRRPAPKGQEDRHAALWARSEHPDPSDPAARWPSLFHPEWQPFNRAWLERGSRLPPRGGQDEPGSQRATLWPIVEARPSEVADWVREATGRTPHEVVAHVLQRWDALRRLDGSP